MFQNLHSEPDLDSIIRISKYFGITIDDLVLKNLNTTELGEKEESEIWKELKSLKLEIEELKKKINKLNKD